VKVILERDEVPQEEGWQSKEKRQAKKNAALNEGFESALEALTERVLMRTDVFS